MKLQIVFVSYESSDERKQTPKQPNQTPARIPPVREGSRRGCECESFGFGCCHASDGQRCIWPCLSFMADITVSSLEILNGSVNEDAGARPTRKVSATIRQITASASAKGVILDIETANESVLSGGAVAIGSDGAASGDCGTSGKDEESVVVLA